MRYLRVKNWAEFQHYKDRNPPWIKLHRTLLDDYEFSCLQDASKAHLILIWLFASQKDGAVPEDPAFLKRKLGLEKEPNLKVFIEHGLLIPEQVASTSTEQIASKVLDLEEERTKASYKAAEEKTARLRADAQQVLEFLNEKTGKSFKAEANLEFIASRLREGATVDDCRAVIARKCRQWLTDEKMNEFLRPATLFNKTNFAQYSGELGAEIPQPKVATP